MLPGDHPEHRERAVGLLAGAGHAGGAHEPYRTVRSERPSGQAWLFVACGCGAELAFPEDAAAPPALALEVDGGRVLVEPFADGPSLLSPAAKAKKTKP